MTAAETLTELAHCSFCGKPETEVAKLIAGAGVHICDECVGLAAKIIENNPGRGQGPRTPMWAALSDDEMLSHIPRVAAHIERAEADLRGWVRELRQRGVTWARIGESLGITRQSAWERFSGEE